MYNSLGLSAYLSSWGQVRPFLEQSAQGSPLLFTSLHISEEFSSDYAAQAKEALHAFSGMGYRVLADVSQKTLAQFGQSDLVAFARQMGLWGLRIDYGFSEAEMTRMAQQLPIVVNASTIDTQEAGRIAAAGGQLIAMHNYYPRPETGLGDDFLRSSSQALQALGIPVYAFIMGDQQKRGPLFCGLPTLEKHRYWHPLAAYLDLVQHFGIDAVFVGDVSIQAQSLAWIRSFVQEGIVPLPAHLHAEYAHLYGQVFSNRPDAPETSLRLAESREYSSQGPAIAPAHCVPRLRGCVTIDNQLYQRYSGEIQVMKTDLPPDPRVNVIGRLAEEFMFLPHCVFRGQRLRFVRPACPSAV